MSNFTFYYKFSEILIMLLNTISHSFSLFLTKWMKLARTYFFCCSFLVYFDIAAKQID